MKKEIKDFSSSIKPTPNLIVSCCNDKGENNALAVGYACNCSFDPPMVMVGIVPSRYSYHMVKETGEFIVNLVTPELKEEFNYLGSHSGRDEDKLKKLNLTYEKGKKVNAPILLDFPVNIECKVVDSLKTGSHEMFAGKVKYIHADSELVNSEGKINYSDIELL
ncbi:MAG: flavin reductase family protein [Bacillota bacterium]